MSVRKLSMCVSKRLSQCKENMSHITVMSWPNYSFPAEHSRVSRQPDARPSEINLGQECPVQTHSTNTQHATVHRGSAVVCGPPLCEVQPPDTVLVSTSTGICRCCKLLYHRRVTANWAPPITAHCEVGTADKRQSLLQS